MRFTSVLLGVATLASIHISSGELLVTGFEDTSTSITTTSTGFEDTSTIATTAGACSNGVFGVQNGDGDVCCPATCRVCGGRNCAKFPPGAASCCPRVIRKKGNMCSDTSQAPCIIDSCSNGIAGVEADNICCEGQCVTCGGVGCSQRPGGEDACCTSNINDSGTACSDTAEAPCIINVCSNGVPGVESGDTCCEAQCGTCGGVGCSQRPGGEDACCTSNIEDSGTMCSETSEAPCIIDLCSNGVPGVEDDGICCETQCGTCGGKGCSQRPGGEDSCCTSNIRDNGVKCSTTSEAPCIIGGTDIEES